MKRKEQQYLTLRDKRVTKANELIQKSRFSLSVRQQKIVLYLISQITPNDENFKLYEFNIVDFCRVAGIDVQGGKSYIEIKEHIKEIADKSIWVRLDDGRETLLRWIERPYIDYNSGTIQIKLDELMRPYLLQLKENFTSYELIYTLAMKSKYSIRLYELIKSIHFQELKEYEKKFQIEELKKILDAEKYKNFKDFHARVLKPAVKDINTYTDKLINYDVLLKGRKAVAIAFTIKTKDSLGCAKVRSDINKELGTDQLTLWDQMKEANLAE